MDANIPALNGTRVFCGVVGGVFNGGVAVAISVDFVVAVLALLTRTGVIGRAVVVAFYVQVPRISKNRRRTAHCTPSGC